MNDTEQRTAIAEACGVPHGQWWCPTCKKWISGAEVTCEEKHDTLAGGCGALVSWYPDYPNDLNAMHEAAMWLRENHPLKYVHYTAAITALVAKFNSDLENRYSISAHDATARQRADAFVQIIEKWKDKTK